MIKAIFFDIDGTLVPKYANEFPPSTEYALNELKKKGIKLFISTGRPVNELKKIRSLFDFDGYITSNGQYCFTNENQTIHKQYLLKEDIEIMLKYAEEQKIPLVMQQEIKNYTNAYYPKDGYFKNQANLFEINKIYSTFQFIVYVDDDEEFVKHFPHTKPVRWNNEAADYIPEDGGKSVGIDYVLEYYGIKLEESMAFGDGGNDIEMLKHCHIGVAMGNADQEVKEAADYITSDYNTGIYDALVHFNILD